VQGKQHKPKHIILNQIRYQKVSLFQKYKIKASITVRFNDRYEFIYFYENGKNPEVKMERGVPALTFHFVGFFPDW